MTSNLWLGTGLDIEIVYLIAEDCNFREQRSAVLTTHWHQAVEKLRLQISSNLCMFPEYRSILTTIEFDDLTSRFPNHPDAIAVLMELYERMPDLMCKRSAAFDHLLKPAKPLSEYIAELEK